MDPKAHDRTLFLKRVAHDLGFEACGVSKAELLSEEAKRLESWLNQGMHGSMDYMQNHFDFRIDPGKLVPGAKSVVSLLFNYFPGDDVGNQNFKVSKYSYGRDYHKVIKKKLQKLLQSLNDEIGVSVQGRCFVDSAPILERAWAARSGLGWVGKNGNLLRKGSGSWYFLAELIIDLELVPDGPVKDYCGSCTKCIDACPTDAIYEPYKVDGSKCISYFTIEQKGESIPDEFIGKFEHWAFGCDICQDVCPINARAKKHTEPDFEPRSPWPELSNQEWVEMTEEVFNKLFEGSPVKRTGLSGIKRNVKFLLKD